MLERQAEQSAAKNLPAAKATLAPDAPNRKARPAPLSADEKKRKARLKAVEEHIAQLEDALTALSRKLENPPADVGEVYKLGQEYARTQEELDRLMNEWTELA
jgi:hypothetical protein